jgi:SOS-response transcriptional repressor LexA
VAGEVPRRAEGRPPGSIPGESRQRLLDLFLEEHRRTGRWPDRALAAAALGMSVQAVSLHRSRLIKEGRLPAAAAARAIQRRSFVLPELPLAGATASGPGSGKVDVAALLTGGRPGCQAFMLEDDALAGPPHHLPSGILLVVHPQADAAPGQLVVARIRPPDGRSVGLVVRELGRAPGGVMLRAPNPEVGELRLEQVELLGVVLGAARRVDG